MVRDHSRKCSRANANSSRTKERKQSAWSAPQWRQMVWLKYTRNPSPVNLSKKPWCLSMSCRVVAMKCTIRREKSSGSSE
jgi:hypothetical protein